MKTILQYDNEIDTLNKLVREVENTEGDVVYFKVLPFSTIVIKKWLSLN